MSPLLGLIFLFGFVGGYNFFWLGAPMPFMLGGILGSACFVVVYEQNGKQLPKVSRWVRLIFIAIIGTMIGSRTSPELLALLPQFWVSGLAIIPFILIAHAGSYMLMRKAGGYRQIDAYFATLPGGIVDSAALAEQAGAARHSTTFHSHHLSCYTVPFLFLALSGEPVGSLAGESISATMIQMS